MDLDISALNLDECRIVLRKFEGDQTDDPFEEIVIENGKIVEVRRKSDGTLK